MTNTHARTSKCTLSSNAITKKTDNKTYYTRTDSPHQQQLNNNIIRMIVYKIITYTTLLTLKSAFFPRTLQVY